MALITYIYDDLDEDQLITFDPTDLTGDRLRFDNPFHQAGQLQIRFQGGDTRVSIDFGPAAYGAVIFDNVRPEQLIDANFNFLTAGFGVVRIGNNSNDETGDDEANLLVGTNFGDFLMGLGGNDTMNGGPGDDMFSFSPGGLAENATFGNDVVTGDAGFDWLYFQGSAPGVNVNLATGNATSSGGSVAFTSIEAVSGTSGNDTLVGDDAANYVDPFSGNDSVSAAGGDDTILGYTGNDTYHGGAGNDWVLYDEMEGGVFVDLDLGAAEDV